MTFPWTIMAITCLSNLIVLLELHSAPICDNLIHKQELPLLIGLHQSILLNVQSSEEDWGHSWYASWGRTSSLYCFSKTKDFVSAIFIDAVLKFD
ncbi:hypothetical protein Patl1_07040 [Pistacia atlantica]|uniref:Uncharacterized protein n=1 Tax=Pistacia atlantica TaxID=434234 RepID=A0ACC1AHG6_9ROSI|nr:hypothetical protein Patl1_07040 [Pistacia atlantica]